jgi:hypothetical protein
MHVTNSVSITYSRRNYILFLNTDKFLNVLHQKKMTQLPYALSLTMIFL